MKKEHQVEIVVEAIKRAFQNKKEILLITEFDEAKIFALQGDPRRLTFLMLLAMKADRKFVQIADVALKVHRGERPPMNDLLEFIKSVLKWKPLDCDNCYVDDCEVKDELHCSKDMPEDMEEMLRELFKTIKDDNDGKESPL